MAEPTSGAATEVNDRLLREVDVEGAVGDWVGGLLDFSVSRGNFLWFRAI